jgi:hypothetical protein
MVKRPKIVIKTADKNITQSIFILEKIGKENKPFLYLDSGNILSILEFKKN